MSFSAAQIRVRAASAQRDFEAAYPGTLVIGSTTFTVSRGAWRNRPDMRNPRDQEIELRSCAIRVRKELLDAANVTLVPGVTTGTLDGVDITLVEQSAGNDEDAFRFTVQATAPASPQE